MKPHQLIFRLMCLPFFAILALIGILWQWLKLCKNFVLHGGEAMAYTKEHNAKTVTEFYNMVNEKDFK